MSSICQIPGVAVQSGASQPGCLMGSAAIRGVDFLGPGTSHAVGTVVPSGATCHEAHLIMEMLHDSGLVASLDLAELNPSLDDRARTSRLMTDLAASLFGHRVLDRATGSH